MINYLDGWKAQWGNKLKYCGILLCGILGLIFLVSRSGAAMELKYFAYPNRVIIYQNGTFESLEPSDNRYGKIIAATHSRVKEPLYVVKLMVNGQLIDAIKKNETVVELLYSQPQKNTYLIHKKSQTFTYTRLLFPLSGSYGKLFFLGDDHGYFSGPLGEISLPADLQLYLEKRQP